MAMETYQTYLQRIRVTLPDDAVIYAPCCKRQKPVFSIRDRPAPPPELEYTDDGFACDSCQIEAVRILEALGSALASSLAPTQDWVAVRYDRNIRLVQTDHFDNERIRERMNPEKLAAIDEYRQWLRDITSLYENSADAARELVDRPVPS